MPSLILFKYLDCLAITSNFDFEKRGSKIMNKKWILPGVFAIIAIVALSALAVAGNSVSVTNKINEDLNGHDDNDNDDNDDDFYKNNTAGGGGWMESSGYKNTFGMSLDGDDWMNSSLVFQARSDDMRIKTIEFSDIIIEDNNGNLSANAWGNASVNGMGEYWFHLLVIDFGKGDKDIFHLWLEVEDQEYHWVALGLGGGNIWIMPST